MLKGCSQLVKLELDMCQALDNQLIIYIVRYLNQLRWLSLRNSHNHYNHLINYDGLSQLKYARFPLEYMRADYFAGVGNKTITLLATKFKESLVQLHLTRNCYVKCATISEHCFSALKECSALNRLSLVYSRKLQSGIGQLLVQHLANLVYLNLQDCCIQEDLSMLGTTCPVLREVDMSGDSWVHESTLVGLAKHPNIRTFHMGHFQHSDSNCQQHFQHSDSNCQQHLQENPSKGMFIQAIFLHLHPIHHTFTHFPVLTTLYLQKNCSLTYWLDIRLLNIRKNLIIKYTTTQPLFTNTYNL